MFDIIANLLRAAPEMKHEPTPVQEDMEIRWHYGSKHHMDIYQNAKLGDYEKRAKEEFEAHMEWKKKEGSYRVEDEERQKKILSSHIAKVKQVHSSLQIAATREDEALYHPEDAIPDTRLTYQEWMDREQLGIVTRRDTAMEIDALRPDLNRRATSSALASLYTSISPTSWMESAASEPGNWPKRQYYYPVTNFGVLKTHDSMSEEQAMLEKKITDTKWNIGGLWTTTAGVTGLILLGILRNAHPIVTVGTCCSVGFGLDVSHAHLKAGKAERDLDDYNIAKTIWFMKNRPDYFQDYSGGFANVTKTTGALDRTSLEGGGMGYVKK
eukprot:TRINITY_DN22261_c0_g1_i1.p1 TRINITY_DN22261_c0_g1~~TRINITY_DN22261_c0_g1_i1.p1  ORF type:complete len:326 (+),score=64.10 TRINITY_DN22261_c0_g1_i1:51-1028(+)